MKPRRRSDGGHDPDGESSWYRRRRRYGAGCGRQNGGTKAMTRFLCLALAAVVLAGCVGATSQARASRVVMSEHNGWTIGVTPSVTSNGTWRARVHAWPKDVSRQSHGGIALRFAESASSESAIVASAITFARSYIDASTLGRDADTGSAPQPRQGRAVMSEHSGWTMRISPSTSAPESGVWRAAVEVWPPGRNPESHSGIQMRFSEVAPDERSIVDSAMRSARRYIDASRTQHQ